LKNRFGNVETDHVNFFWHGNILLFDHSPCSPLKGGGGRGRPCHHVRRRFYELAAAGPAPIASEALRRIAELYRVEDDIRSQPADARRAARQERSQPILAELEPWLREKLGLISHKTQLADAIRHTTHRLVRISRLLVDG